MKKVKNKMPKVLGNGVGLTPLVRKADWQLAKENPHKVKKPLSVKGLGKHENFRKGRKTEVPPEVKMEIAKEKAGGASNVHLAQKYGVSIQYVADALQSVYVSSKVGREILKNVILENGIASGMHARKGIDTLTPMQAIMATGIMSSKFVELEKHTSANPVEVDFNELKKIGEGIKEITDLIGDIPDDTDDAETFIDV